GEHDAEGRGHRVEGRIGEGQRLGIRLPELDGEAVGSGSDAAALEQARNVVGRDDVAPAPCRGEREVAVAGSYVEHLLPRADIERLAQRLADDLQGGADHSVVAGRPGAMLACLERVEVDLGRLWGLGENRNCRNHFVLRWQSW